MHHTSASDCWCCQCCHCSRRCCLYHRCRCPASFALLAWLSPIQPACLALLGWTGPRPPAGTSQLKWNPASTLPCGESVNRVAIILIDIPAEKRLRNNTPEYVPKGTLKEFVFTYKGNQYTSGRPASRNTKSTNYRMIQSNLSVI